MSAEDMPETPLFDRARSLRGYQLNKMAMSLAKADNRQRFRADEPAYLRSFQLNEEQQAAVRNRDWREMVRLGGNIFFILKIAAADGKQVPLTAIGAHQAAMDHADFLRDRLGKT